MGPRAERPLVLVVEDEPAAAAALQEALIHADCDVEVVDSAEAALLALGRRFFSLVVVDLILPGLDGRNLLQRMTEAPHLAHIPAIVVSGHSVALPHNAVAFLRKPIEPEELRGFVRRYTRP